MKSRTRTQGSTRSPIWRYLISKIAIGFISNFLLKARVLYLTILKQKKIKLTFKGWNRPDCHLFGFTRVSLCQTLLHFTLGQWSESWRRRCRVSFSVVFLLVSASFKNSSSREKVGKLSSFWDWWAESLFLSIIVAKYNILSRANTGHSRKKNKKILAKRFARAIGVHYRDFEHD